MTSPNSRAFDRQPIVAGTFYTADARQLYREVQAWLKPQQPGAKASPDSTGPTKAASSTGSTDSPGSTYSAGPTDSPGSTGSPGSTYSPGPTGPTDLAGAGLQPPSPRPHTPRMLLLPHAGHVYCGQIIGATLARVHLPDLLVLLCPNHSGRGQALALWPEGQWHSPLGPVPVDSALAQEILASGAGFVADTEAHASEHALEVLLPFLQCHSPGCRIVPIAVALNDYAGLQQAGQALGRVIKARRAAGQDVGIVVSSDMNHYADQQETLRKDNLALIPLLDLQPEALCQVVQAHTISMCGLRPAIVGICASKEQQECHAELVQHATSGDISGDMERVVGYCGIIVD